MSQQCGIRLYKVSQIPDVENEHRGETEVCLFLVFHTAQVLVIIQTRKRKWSAPPDSMISQTSPHIPSHTHIHLWMFWRRRQKEDGIAENFQQGNVTLKNRTECSLSKVKRDGHHRKGKVRTAGGWGIVMAGDEDTSVRGIYKGHAQFQLEQIHSPRLHGEEWEESHNMEGGCTMSGRWAERSGKCIIRAKKRSWAPRKITSYSLENRLCLLQRLELK